MDTHEDSVSFDDILKSIRNNGVTSSNYTNLFIILSVPDHWCHVPASNGTNTEEWKTTVIPKSYDSSGKQTFNSCKMFNVTQTNSSVFVDVENTLDCQFGWEYDTTWFDSTLVSQENWVCEKDTYAANTLTFGRFAEVFGSFLFSYLGDTLGRKPVMLATTVLLLCGRVMLLFFGGNLAVFVVAVILSSLPSALMMISVVTVGVEINTIEESASIMMFQTNGWSVGLALLNLMIWYLRDWKYLVIATSFPCFIYCLLYRYMVESPRWLIGRGKLNKCIVELQKIANVNGTKLPSDVEVNLTILANRKTENYSLLDFFHSCSITRSTLCLTICWSASAVTYYTLLMNALNVGDNIFVSAFWQAMAEIPANFFGMWSCNRLGRRRTQIISHSGSVLISAVLIFTIADENFSWLNVVLASANKFAVALSMYALFVHTAEIYPTYLRQSSLTMGALIISISTALCPYIVYLGTNVNIRYPFVILSVYELFSTMCAVLLPETLSQKLPETLQETQELIDTQSIFFKQAKSNSESVESN